MSIFTSKNGDWFWWALLTQSLIESTRIAWHFGTSNHSNKTNQQGYQSSQLVSKNTWWRSWTWPGVALLNAFYRRQSTFIPVTVKSLYSGSFGGCFHKLSIFKDVMQNTIESTSTRIRPACEHQKNLPNPLRKSIGSLRAEPRSPPWRPARAGDQRGWWKFTRRWWWWGFLLGSHQKRPSLMMVFALVQNCCRVFFIDQCSG